MYKTLSINMVSWLSYLESEGFMQNGFNQILEIYCRDHLRQVIHNTLSGTQQAADPERAAETAITAHAKLSVDAELPVDTGPSVNVRFTGRVAPEGSAESGKAAFALQQQATRMFSRREKEVLLWMAEGLSSKMIAHKLHISEHTVINHRRSMQEKSHKPNATALVSYAIRNGII